MKLPAIIVNFKLHEQATGDSAVRLAKIHQQVAEETGASIGIAVSMIDLARVAQEVSIPVFAQHIDAVGYGSHTGFVSPQQVKELGCYGTLLNHAEHPLEDVLLRRSIEMAKDNDLFVIACAHDPQRGKKILEFNPDLIAVEPPELIGGDISVSKHGPDIIESAVNLIGKNRLLVGAGVRDEDDVRIATTLGAGGVLLASGVTKAQDPYSVLLDLVAGLR